MSTIGQPSQNRYVMLHIGTGPSATEEASGTARLVVRDEAPIFPLNDNVWIERLDEQFAKSVQQACEPPHFNISLSPWDRHLYAFVRRVETVEATPYAGMGELFAVAALSRLVRPTTVGGRYCAKIFNLGEGDKYCIEAVQFKGGALDVTIGPRKSDWLSVDDAGKLRELLPWLLQTMHRRVHRAYWNHEYAMRTYYLDARWMFVVSGLEALVNVGQHKCAAQFRERCLRLAAAVKVDLTEDELRKAYVLRSKLVHAENFLFGLETDVPKTQQIELSEKLEDLLRAIVLRCLSDAGFGEDFRDGTAVKKAFPSSAD